MLQLAIVDVREDDVVIESFNSCHGADYPYGRTRLPDELDEFCLDDRTVLRSVDFPVDGGLSGY